MAAAAPVRRRMARGWKKASIRATPPVRNKKQLRSRNIWSRELIKGGGGPGDSRPCAVPCRRPMFNSFPTSTTRSRNGKKEVHTPDNYWPRSLPHPPPATLVHNDPASYFCCGTGFLFSLHASPRPVLPSRFFPALTRNTF